MPSLGLEVSAGVYSGWYLFVILYFVGISPFVGWCFIYLWFIGFTMLIFTVGYCFG